jgi:hypothetical protein
MAQADKPLSCFSLISADMVLIESGHNEVGKAGLHRLPSLLKRSFPDTQEMNPEFHPLSLAFQ